MKPHGKEMKGPLRISQNSHGDWVLSGHGLSMAFDTKEEAEKARENLR